MVINVINSLSLEVLAGELQLDYSGGRMGCQIELFLLGRGIFVILMKTKRKEESNYHVEDQAYF